MHACTVEAVRAVTPVGLFVGVAPVSLLSSPLALPSLGAARLVALNSHTAAAAKPVLTNVFSAED